MEDHSRIEIAEDLKVTVYDPDDGYRTCPECGTDCEPVPFDTDGDGIRVSFVCPEHGAHTVIDPFADHR